MNSLRTIVIGTVAAAGVGLIATGCKQNKVVNQELYETKELMTPDYNRYCTDTIRFFDDGSTKVKSDTIYEIFRPIVDENKNIVGHTPWHYKSLKDGRHYLQMRDNIVVSFNNIDSAMRALANDTIAITKKIH